MLGQSIFSGYLSLAIIVLVLRHVIKSSGVQMLLQSVHSYYCVDPSANPATRLKPEDLRTKKGRKQYVKQQLEIKGASEQVYRQTLSARVLQTLPFSDDINVLVTITLSLLLNSVYVVLMATLLGMETGIVTVGISLMLVIYTVVVLIKVDYAAESRKWVDNMVILLVFLVGAVAALAALLLAPKYTLQAGEDGPQVPLLAFDVGKAAQGVDALLGAMHARVAQRLKNDVPAPPDMDPVYMAAAVAVWAGMLAVAMLGPAMQYSKLLYRSMQIPSWGEPYMTRSWGTIKLMQLGFIMPIAMTVSQIPALAVYWGLDMDHSQVIAGVLLLLLALVHYLATAPLCQAYLDAGLAEWHTLLHNGYEFEGKMGVVRVRLDLLRALLGKTCVQLVSPALVACSLGLMLMLNSGLTQQAAHRLAEPRAAILARLPPGLSAALTYRASAGAGSNANATFGLGNLTTAGIATDTLTDPSRSISDSAAALPADSASDHVGQVEEEGLFGLTEDGSTVTLQVDPTDKQSSKPDSKVESAEEGKVKALGNPSQLWLFLGHFLGWWSCLVWSIYACCSLTVYRMGLNSG